MRKLFNIVSVLAILVLILGACSPAGTDESDTTEAPVPTEPETSAGGDALTDLGTEPPPLQTVDLPGPLMEVGSKFLYVDGTVLVAVPGGPFTMGYNFADNPERVVTEDDFWAYGTKVTNQQFALCVELGKCTPPNPEDAPNFGNVQYTNFPVTGVTHQQAAEYCAFVKASLPTEAQWEKLARGPDGNIFPWGNDAPTCQLTNYGLCKGQPNSVNDYPDGKSYYEAWDMSGNVREWTADWYSPDYNVENPVANPPGPENGEKRAVRGSSYADSANMTIAAHRFSEDPQTTSEDLGFRCVVEDPTVFAPWCELIGYAGIGPDGSPAECTPVVNCNDVNIDVNPFCDPQGIQPSYTIVTFEMSNNPPDGWSYSAPGCNPIPGEKSATSDKFQCDPPGPAGPATATGSCTDAAGCAATCPPHYNKVGDKCEWDGSSTLGTECLPGATYDPLLHCCTAAPGTAVDFGLCPVGFFQLNGVCVPNPKGFVEKLQVPIEIIEVCTDPPGGGDDGGGGNDGGGDDGGGGTTGGGNPGQCGGRTNPCPP